MWLNILEGALWLLVAFVIATILCSSGYALYFHGYNTIGAIVALVGATAWSVITSFGVTVGSGTAERRILKN